MNHFKHVLLMCLLSFRNKYAHLLDAPQKKFNEGEKVIVCGDWTATVCKPRNQDFDLERNTWVHHAMLGYRCYANYNLTRHPDQSRSSK